MNSKWNATVKCVDIKDAISFTEGYLYNIKNGVILNDRYKAYGEYSSLEELNESLMAKFIEVIPEPKKEYLESGMRVVLRNGKQYYILLPVNSLIGFESGFESDSIINLNRFNDDLFYKDLQDYGKRDIMQVYDEDDKLVMERVELFEPEKKIESLEKRLDSLEKKIEILNKALKD